MTFFDELPTPPSMMPLFRYKRLVTDREAARKAAAALEAERLDALTPSDRAFLTAFGCDLDRLRMNCEMELIMETSYR